MLRTSEPMIFVKQYCRACYNISKVVIRELPEMIDYKEFITINAGKRSGKPCIRNLRITVYDILKMLANGMRPNQIIDDFPELTEDDVYASLAYAADKERGTENQLDMRIKASQEQVSRKDVVDADADLFQHKRDMIHELHLGEAQNS